MAQAPDTDSSQGWIQAVLSQTYPAGSTIEIVSDGTVVESYQATVDFQAVTFSSSAISTS